MTVKVLFIAVVLGGALLAAMNDAVAQTAGAEPGASALSAYAQVQQKRARTRVRVTPRCPYRVESVPYPVPYECDYPGPGYVRQCESWLAPDPRPSGTVIVPHKRCWWARG